MPTSSQALIILATEGRLPRNAPRRIFPVSSVPYPVRHLDVSRQCMECSKNEDDDKPTNIYEAMRRGRVRWANLAESLPEILRISRYRGLLTYDVESRLLDWQVNHEYTPRQWDPSVNVQYDWRNENQNQVRLPDIYQNTAQVVPPYSDRQIRYDAYYNQEDVFNISRDNDVFVQEKDSFLKEDKTEKQPSKAPSLPVLFRARIDDDTYRRLCGLNFKQKRASFADINEKGKSKPSSDPKQMHAIRAWENHDNTDDELVEKNPETLVSYDKIKDKDFRIEDLTLNTENLTRAPNFKLTTSHDLQGHSDSLRQYMKERREFFAKYGNYEADNAVLTPARDAHTEHKLKARKMLQAKLILPDIGSFPLIKAAAEVQTTDESGDLQKPPEKKSLIDEVKEKSNYKKWKKKRLTSVRLRKEAPPSDPLCVCFSLKDNAKSHEEIKTLVEEQIGTTVEEIQFDPVSVHAIDSDARSRWIVRMKDASSRDLVVDIGLIIDDERVEVRSLDEAMKEEVEAYKLYSLVQQGQIRMPGEEPRAPAKRRRSRGHVTMTTAIRCA